MLCYASLPGRLLHELLLVDELLLPKVEDDRGATSSTSTTAATAVTMAYGHERRGVAVQALRTTAQHLAARVRS
jgi:hypothetical protein